MAPRVQRACALRSAEASRAQEGLRRPAGGRITRGTSAGGQRGHLPVAAAVPLLTHRGGQNWRPRVQPLQASAVGPVPERNAVRLHVYTFSKTGTHRACGGERRGSWTDPPASAARPTGGIHRPAEERARVCAAGSKSVRGDPYAQCSRRAARRAPQSRGRNARAPMPLTCQAHGRARAKLAPRGSALVRRPAAPPRFASCGLSAR